MTAKFDEWRDTQLLKLRVPLPSKYLSPRVAVHRVLDGYNPSDRQLYLLALAPYESAPVDSARLLDRTLIDITTKDVAVSLYDGVRSATKEYADSRIEWDYSITHPFASLRSSRETVSRRWREMRQHGVNRGEAIGRDAVMLADAKAWFYQSLYWLSGCERKHPLWSFSQSMKACDAFMHYHSLRSGVSALFVGWKSVLEMYYTAIARDILGAAVLVDPSVPGLRELCHGGPSTTPRHVEAMCELIDEQGGEKHGEYGILGDMIEDMPDFQAKAHFLAHCRQHGRHWHGCWLIEFFLGRLRRVWGAERAPA